MTSKPGEIVMENEECTSRGDDDQVVRNVKFGESLEQFSSDWEITPIYSVTYLNPIDLSTDLMVSRRILDYVIDINIYRHILKTKILHLRKQFINYDLLYIDYIRPLTIIGFLKTGLIKITDYYIYMTLYF